MSTKKLLLAHLLSFLILLALLVLFSEDLLDVFLPGIHGVETWLSLLFAGTVVLFIFCMISFLALLRRKKRKFP